MDVALVLVNQFPLFALLLRVKDPARLPGKCGGCTKAHMYANIHQPVLSFNSIPVVVCHVYKYVSLL